MPLSSPPETYGRMIQYGLKKVKLGYVQLALQSFCGGLWVGVYGHCCTVVAGSFYHSNAPYYQGITKCIYGGVFPGALVAILFTGSELFTGNTVTMIMCLLDKKCGVLSVLRVWTFSLFGNFLGAFATAGFSKLSGVFSKGLPEQYLEYMAMGKMSHGWGATLILGIGCNLLVCLGVWSAVVCDDGAGKILAMWFPIMAFAVGGFEHIVANFYTLSLALFEKSPGLTIFDVIFNNWCPVLIGNMIAGCLMTGLLWWYSFHPPTSELDLCTEKELFVALASRVMTDEPSGSADPPDRRATYLSALRSIKSHTGSTKRDDASEVPPSPVLGPSGAP